MKTARTLSLVLFLFIPFATFAQTSRATNAAANRSWQKFWQQFSAAVNKRDRAALKSMMATPFESSDEGTPAQWIKFMDENDLWRETQQSVATGTKPFGEYSRDIGKPSRVTNRRHLIFVFSNGRWQWWGIMGD